jgi:hypothetical protein
MLMPLQIGVEILHSYFPVVEKERQIGTDLANALKPIAIGVPLSPPLTSAQKQQLDRARSVNDARRDLKTFLSRVNERLPEENKSPATLLRELYDMLLARKFPAVEARLTELGELELDVPALTRGSVQLALTTSSLTYPILVFEDDPEEREPRPVIRQATLQGYKGPSLSRSQITRLLDLRNFLANGPERSFRLDLIGAESHFGRARSGPPGSGAQIQQCRIAIDEYTKLLPESFVDNLTKEPFTIPTLDLGPLFGDPPMFARHKFLLIRLASAYVALGDALFRRSFGLSAEARAEIAKQYVIAIRAVVRSKVPLDNDLRRDIKSYALQQHAKVQHGQNFLGYRDSFVPDRTPATLADLADRRIQAAIRAAERFHFFKTGAEALLADLAEMEQEQLEAEMGLDIARLQVDKAEERVGAAGDTIREIQSKLDGLELGLAADLTKSVFVTAALGAGGVSFEGAEANLGGVFSAFVGYDAARAEAQAQLRAAESQERIAQRDRDIANLERQIASSRVAFLEDAIAAKKQGDFNADRLFGLASLYEDLNRRHVDTAFEMLYLYERAIAFRRLKTLNEIQPGVTAVDPLAAGDFLNEAFLELNEQRKEDGPGQNAFPLRQWSLRTRHPLEFARFLQDRSMEFVISLYEAEKLLPGTFNVRVKRIGVELRPSPPGGFQGKLTHRGVTLLRDGNATLNPPSTRLVPTEPQLERAIADVEGGKKDRIVVEGVVPLVLGENRLLFSSEPDQTIPEGDELFDLLPIENYGMTGTWRLQIDDGELRNVTDVVLHFLVSVPQSPEPLEEHIRNLIQRYEDELAKGGALDRILTVPLRRRFPDAFDELEVGPGPFTLREQDFPDDITDLRVKAIVAQAVDGDGKGVSGIGLEISKPGTPVSLTRTTGADGFSEDLDVEVPPIPEADRPGIEGDWQVRLLDPEQFSSLDDLLLFFVYTFSVVPSGG